MVRLSFPFLLPCFARRKAKQALFALLLPPPFSFFSFLSRLSVIFYFFCFFSAALHTSRARCSRARSMASSSGLRSGSASLFSEHISSLVALHTQLRESVVALETRVATLEHDLQEKEKENEQHILDARKWKEVARQNRKELAEARKACSGLMGQMYKAACAKLPSQSTPQPSESPKTTPVAATNEREEAKMKTTQRTKPDSPQRARPRSISPPEMTAVADEKKQPEADVVLATQTPAPAENKRSPPRTAEQVSGLSLWPKRRRTSPPQWPPKAAGGGSSPPRAARPALAGGGSSPPRAARPALAPTKFNTVVRGKARAALPAFECAACSKFYAVAGLDMATYCKCDVSQKKMPRLQDTSRHRARYEAPADPPGFWDLDPKGMELLPDD